MKLFAALFVALLAVHASTQSPLNNNASTKEVIVQILNEVLKVTTSLLTSANSMLDDLKANEKELTDKLANFVAEELQAVNGIIVSLINELEDGATEQGKTVLACVDAEQEKVDAAILKTALIIADNAVSEYPLITDFLEVVLRQASELQEDIKLQTDSLDTCDSADELCLAAFAATALNIIKGVSANIQENYDGLVTVVNTIISDIKAWDIRSILREDTQAIFNELVACIYS